ncbi:MAG: class I SAM-dependent methyltransferase [Candidatus Komeilibacteria bacterium]|nr:class I SAM-dependent methyltransferase [Candidatus Komeilibacteria bacterium]
MREFEEIIEFIKTKSQNSQGVFLYLPNLTDFQKQEMEFHDAIHQDEIEVHQLNALRNVYYHNYFKKFLYRLPKSSVILEVGSGSGYDLFSVLEQGYNLIASDISPASVGFIKKQVDVRFSLLADKIIYLVADGQNLPLPDNSVDAVFLVACLHHFENQHSALTEIARVLKPGGQIILAMEPSRFMMWFTKLFSSAKGLRIHDGHSEADETHPGYGRSDWEKIIADNPLSMVRLKRVWLLQGFLHYGLEALFRIFKLKKRIKLPLFIEWPLLIIDELLLKIPIINQLNWHWIAVISRI